MGIFGYFGPWCYYAIYKCVPNIFCVPFSSLSWLLWSVNLGTIDIYDALLDCNKELQRLVLFLVYIGYAILLCKRKILKPCLKLIISDEDRHSASFGFEIYITAKITFRQVETCYKTMIWIQFFDLRFNR